jgi:hypothetical protein
MRKYAADIERSMAFLVSGDLKKSISHSDAVAHLAKARNLLENVGRKAHSQAISTIIKRAESIDDSDIEVTG